MGGESSDTKQAIAFGPFRLFATERLLERDGVAVPLGSRALDILIALVERAGEVVDKKELMARAWPNLTVDESSLRFHVASLRRTLGQDQTGARYVTNVSGRGYCFVAPAARDAGHKGPAVAETVTPLPHRLPPRLRRMVGRDDTLRALAQQLADRRFVTVHGPGGIGKTTLAIALGHEQLANFQGTVCFLDLGPLTDPHLVPGALASALGLAVQSSDPTPDLINFLQDQRMLLILDSCEHVIERTAALAERIFQEAPQVSILATSREPLRVEGEQVHRLAALDSPPEGVELTPAQILSFPAARLFVDRATASGHSLELTAADASIVGATCRKLDGIALAIELAAGRVGAYGLHQTVMLLDNRLQLLWSGRRTALPRHQTLNATLDWSYDLISEVEQTVLRRLSVFVGTFTLQAARAVLSDDTTDTIQVTEALTQLVTKSLVSPIDSGTVTRYRLLDATRVYANGKLIDSGEADTMARRHAVFYRALLEGADLGPAGGLPSTPAFDARDLGNIRSALTWSLSERGDSELGTTLAAAAIRPMSEMSLFAECLHWSERAIAALDEGMRGSRCEMELQAALGVSVMFAEANDERARAALSRAIEIAEKIDDPFSQFRFICRLHLFSIRTGDCSGMLDAANQARLVADRISDTRAMLTAHWLMGAFHHLRGNQVEARSHIDSALWRRPESETGGMRPFIFGYDYRHIARIILARIMWLQGYAEQAGRLGQQTVKEAYDEGHKVSICIALMWTIMIARWSGNLAGADDFIARFETLARANGFGPYVAVGEAFKGEMLIRRGDTDAGVAMLAGAQHKLHTHRHELYMSEFECAMAEGLMLKGDMDRALQTIDRAIALATQKGGRYNSPELIRVRGEILARRGDEAGAEASFRASIEMADRQSALSWRLRAATSLARLGSHAGIGGEKILAETYSRFSEGFATSDLMCARELLSRLHGDAGPDKN